MVAKTERIEMRADPESSARIAQAAQLERVSVSVFILDAAIKAADHVLARHDVTVMPADQFDQLMDSLDAPDEAPALERLAARSRRFKRA